MQFSVPQFIEHEPKIISFLTFKQVIIVAIMLAPCIIFYFILPFILFLILSLACLGLGLFLAAGKIQGIPITDVLLKSIGFNLKPKRYIWQKKEVKQELTPIYKKSLIKPTELKAESKEKKEEKTPLKIAEKSRLKNLLTELEIYRATKINK
ncbi:MAG: PrgI family mobile element protein [Minisyncoccales bacterium]